MTLDAQDRRWELAALFAVLLAYTLAWSWVQFECDDAYIAYRHVANAVAGHGLTFNPPPLQAVEGYTSFLWVLLLWAAWAWAGLAPPLAAQLFGWLAGCAALAALWAWMKRRPGFQTAGPARALLLALGLAVAGLNFSVVAWTSSGLESGLVVLWVTLFGLALLDGSPRLWLWAALWALTRPDGLIALPVAALVHWGHRREERWQAWSASAGLVLAHLLWRHHSYGEWLPNTYYAKVVQPDLHAGARYLALFILEHNLWLGLALLPWAWRRLAPQRSAWILLSALGALMLGYYAWRAGGDHFEFRLFAPWIGLGAAALFAALGADGASTPRKALLLSAVLAATLLFPWQRFTLGRSLEGRERTTYLALPLAPSYPRWLGPVLAPQDALQASLARHSTAVRVREHEIFAQYLLAHFPPRRESSAWDLGAFPLVQEGSVGVLGWMLPQAYILDSFGLCDAVTARTKVSGPWKGALGHARGPAPAYLACMAPNFRWQPGTGLVGKPLRDEGRGEKAAQCEKHFLALAKAGALSSAP